MDGENARNALFHSNGTTALETYSVIFPCALLTFITTTASSFIVISSYAKLFIVDFAFLVIPLILNVTIFANLINEIIFTLVCISICTLMVRQETPERPAPRQLATDCTKLNYITNLRSTINIMSVLAILAVDFPVFPRRFTKTETVGYSLMDVGVGLYVLSNGIVAPQVHAKSTSLTNTIKSTIPLIILGTARFLLVKELDYHVPVAEYGVHWNFFITLAVTKILCSLILKVIPIQYAIIISVCVLLVHEVGLQLFLFDFVMNQSERDTFWKANREGIVSIPGYIGLYFISVGVGDILGIRNRHHMRMKFKFGLKLIACSFTFLWATLLLDKNFGVSRRLANSGYCAWVMFIGISMLSFYYLFEQIQMHIYRLSNIQHPIYVPFIFEAINYNGLAYFLLCNVLTGIINLPWDTMTFETNSSLMIIILYMLINSAVMCVLYYKNIKLKL